MAGIVLVCFLVLTIYMLAQHEKIESKSEITVKQVKEKLENKEDVFLLDVRTEQEYNGDLGHIEGAVLIPVSELKNRMDELKDEKEKEIIVICRSGNRSAIATNILKDEGYSAINMRGGMISYNAMQQKSLETENQDEDTIEKSKSDHQ
jgi:rhodanese-related sulfurtransferase